MSFATPNITFFEHPTEVRDATISAGSLKFVDVTYVRINTPGDNLSCPEKKAESYIAQLDAQSSGVNPRMPREFYDLVVRKYEAHKAGKSPSHEGYLVTMWAAIGPSEVKNLHSMNTYTVEQISDWNDEAMRNYGANGRQLRDKARLFLESSDQKTQQITVLAEENKALKNVVDKMQEQIKELQAQMSEDRPKVGRPSKQLEAA